MNMGLRLGDLNCSALLSLPLEPLSSLWEVGLTDTADAIVGCVVSGVIARAECAGEDLLGGPWFLLFYLQRQTIDHFKQP